MLDIDPRFLPRIRRNEPMSRHTSWHVGGPAELFFTPHDRDELAAFMRVLPRSVPVHWLGLGSNLLVRDAGLKGVVIATQGALERLERRDQTTVYVEAGVACARLAKQCVKWGLGPAEFFAGIPGTLGGALAMNAGAFGGETWRQVLEVETLDRGGGEHRRLPQDFDIGYRQARARHPEEGFLAARLAFEVKPGTSAADVRELLERRRAAQPIGEWSCGSVFTNPPGEHAARLIEAAGLKGFRIGDASVSDKHANFIINHGGASARDLEELIRHVQATVERAHGVRLVPEVRILGEALAAAARTESTH
jgi:UDP-N-acetylmuramate dehydrogenase